MTSPSPPRNVRPVRLATVVIGVALVLLLGVASVVAMRRDVARLDPRSPEATAQTYLRAIADRRRAVALGTFTDGLRSRCGPSLTAMTPFPDVTRATLVTTVVTGDHARVGVAITEATDGGLLTMNESTFEETLDLTRTAEGWRISTVPWPLYDCVTEVRR